MRGAAATRCPARASHVTDDKQLLRSMPFKWRIRQFLTEAFSQLRQKSAKIETARKVFPAWQKTNKQIMSGLLGLQEHRLPRELL